MAIAIIWAPGSGGRQELWLAEAGRPRTQVLAVDAPESRETVERWSAQADSVPEFLRCYTWKDSSTSRIVTP